MPKQEKTSARVARTAAKALTKPSASAQTKSIAGSALSQVRAGKMFSPKAAKHASAVLRDDKSGPAVGSMAGSVLTQRPDATKKVPAKAAKKAASTAGPALAQQVATRRTTDGKLVRVVLMPYRGGSLRRDRVESVVSSVLARHKKK